MKNPVASREIRITSIMQKKMVHFRRDFGLTPLQLETRFWGQTYLDLA